MAARTKPRKRTSAGGYVLTVRQVVRRGTDADLLLTSGGEAVDVLTVGRRDYPLWPPRQGDQVTIRPARVVRVTRAEGPK